MADEIDDGSFGPIDLSKLEEEWVKQPGRVEVWGTKLVEAKKLLAEAEIELDVVKADLDQRIRQKPEKYGIETLREPSVKSVITKHSRTLAAEQKVIDTKFRVDLYGIKMTALDHRKKGLESLVQLWSQSYFATPKTTINNQEKISDARSKIVRTIGSKKKGKE